MRQSITTAATITLFGLMRASLNTLTFYPALKFNDMKSLQPMDYIAENTGPFIPNSVYYLAAASFVLGASERIIAKKYKLPEAAKAAYRISLLATAGAAAASIAFMLLGTKMVKEHLLETYTGSKCESVKTIAPECCDNIKSCGPLMQFGALKYVTERMPTISIYTNLAYFAAFAVLSTAAYASYTACKKTEAKFSLEASEQLQRLGQPLMGIIPNPSTASMV
ncbi:MAG: hypothetical protein P1U40_12130 [Coxiellaceae bacterium]|nr:hypothetical protein [Coxiellaceae bacterium]